jgi:subtilisin family serine protease
MDQALEWFNGQKSVENVEPNYLIPLQFLPNDPFFAYQWSLNNVGQIGGTPSADIDMSAAWDIEQGFQGVVIAIVDTGVDYLHEDLTDSIWQNPGEIAANGIDDDQNGYVDDIRGWGSPQKSYVIESAIAFAAEHGAIVVVSAGNQNSSFPFFPAATDIDAIVAVGATDDNDHLGFFSNYGDWVDVYAPGVNIVSTYLTNSYAITSGTSISAAIVSGIAGLIWSINPDPTHVEVKQIFLNSVDRLKSVDETRVTGGRVNAKNALAYTTGLR